MGRNILFVAFHYPPESNGGVQRPYAFVKYLRKFGYNTVVVTTDSFGKMDHETGVYRVHSFNGELKGKSIWRKIYIVTIKVLRKIIYNTGMLFIHNYRWTLNIKRELDKLIPNLKPDVVIATYKPLNNLFVGHYIKRKYNIPLIIDFRDGFLFEGLEKYNFVQKKEAQKIEKLMVDNSDAIITVSPPISEYFVKTYNKKNVFTIYNGFDVQDIDSFIAMTKPEVYRGKFKLFYFGGISSSRKRDASPLFSALKSLKEEGYIDESNFEFRIYGKLNKRELGLIKKLGLEDIIIFNGYINRIEGLKIMKNEADALLFYGDPYSKSVVSTKLLEYIFLGKPILGICKGNEAEEIILRTNTGTVVDFSIENIISGMKNIMDYKTFEPCWKEINKFSRELQTLQLINIIEKVASANE